MWTSERWRWGPAPKRGGFLRHTQLALGANEAANSLMLGICLGLHRQPDLIKTPSCVKTVEDETDLVLAAMMTACGLVVYGY